MDEGDENYYVETTSPGGHDADTPDSSLVNRIRTGLSQSNVSLSSTSGPNNYCYGNQQGYDAGSHGYPLYYGYSNDDTPQRSEATPCNYYYNNNNNNNDNNSSNNNSSKPKITSAVYKNRANSKGSLELLDGPLLSDSYARNDYNNDPIQEEQIRLGNTSSTSNSTDNATAKTKTKGFGQNEKQKRLSKMMSIDNNSSNTTNPTTTTNSTTNKAESNGKIENGNLNKNDLVKES